MPSTSETGHAKNVANYEKLITSINPFAIKKEPTPISNDCICSFNIEWDISGIKDDSACVYLIRGQIFKNYDTKLLDKTHTK